MGSTTAIILSCTDGKKYLLPVTDKCTLILIKSFQLIADYPMYHLEMLTDYLAYYLKLPQSFKWQTWENFSAKSENAVRREVHCIRFRCALHIKMTSHLLGWPICSATIPFGYVHFYMLSFYSRKQFRKPGLFLFLHQSGVLWILDYCVSLLRNHF